ncbi:ABC transporter permease [Dermacoccus nishinomiyaensis]
MSTTTSTFTPRLDGAPLDPSERRAPRGSGLNARVMGLELRRVLRNRRSLIFTLIFPIAMFFFVASSISEGDQVIGNGVVANVNAYLMVNMALYGAIMAATSAGASVSIERAAGWSRQLRLTPLQPVAYIVIKMIAAIVMALIAVSVTFAAGLGSGKAHADVLSWLEAGAVIVAGSLVFAALGLLLGYLLPSDSVMQMLGGLMAIMSMLGGIFFPIKDGSTFDHFAQFTPMYGIGKLAQWRLSLTTSGGHGSFHLVWALNLVAWGLLFIGGAAWSFRRDTARV